MSSPQRSQREESDLSLRFQVGVCKQSLPQATNAQTQRLPPVQCKPILQLKHRFQGHCWQILAENKLWMFSEICHSWSQPQKISVCFIAGQYPIRNCSGPHSAMPQSIPASCTTGLSTQGSPSHPGQDRSSISLTWPGLVFSSRPAVASS